MNHHTPFMSEFAQDPRVLRLGRALVETDQTDAILDMLGRALRFANSGHQGGIHLVTGDTNTGKTSAIRAFMMQLANQIGGVVEFSSPPPNGKRSPVASVEYVSVPNGENIFRPVVHIEVGRHPTFNSSCATSSTP